MAAAVQLIDEDRLYTDIEYRYQYLCDFIGITEDDIKLVHGAGAVLGPKTDEMVEVVYSRLFSFSCTKKVFFKERSKYDDPSDDVTLENYDLATPQMEKRKSAIKSFLGKMLTQPYDHDMIKEFDNLGRVHCSVGVDLVHMMACQGFVQDAVIGALFAYKNSGEEGSDEFDAVGTTRAFCKILAVKTQFISCWYEDPSTRAKRDA